MIYFRKFIISFLNTPGVSDICADTQHDLEEFIHKFYDNHSLRVTKDNVKKLLVEVLADMDSDGILACDIRRRQNTDKNHTFFTKVYRLKDKDHFMVSESFNKPSKKYYTIMSNA